MGQLASKRSHSKAEYLKRWKKAHPESVKASQRKWREANKDRWREYYKKWRKANLQYFLNWNKANREKLTEQHRRYSKTEGGRQTTRKASIKCSAKRRRGLGFTPISLAHKWCVWHHVGMSDVVACPKHIHEKTHHFLKDKSALKIEGILG